MILYLKALHLIFVVTWFAGLFYLVRLFIYWREAQDLEREKREVLSDQFQLMVKRLLYGITWPSAILAGVFGLWMLHESPGYLKLGFMQVKLAFVGFLYVYHVMNQMIYNQFASGFFKWSSMQLRVWNEVATIFLVAIVFMIILKSATDWIYGIFGLIGFAISLMLAIRIYKSLRNNNKA